MDSEQKAVFKELLNNMEETSLSLEESVKVYKEHTEQQLLEDQREESIIKDKVKTTLSTKEQSRLRNIGHFFTEGAFKVIDNFIKKRDKEASMNTDVKKNSKTFLQKVGGAFKTVKNVAQSSWFKKLLLGVGALYLLSVLMRDKLVDFFSNLWSNVKPMFEGIVDGIKGIFEKTTRRFQRSVFENIRR